MGLLAPEPILLAALHVVYVAAYTTWHGTFTDSVPHQRCPGCQKVTPPGGGAGWRSGPVKRCQEVPAGTICHDMS